jgi:hypothetical protein
LLLCRAFIRKSAVLLAQLPFIRMDMKARTTTDGHSLLPADFNRVYQRVAIRKTLPAYCYAVGKSLLPVDSGKSLIAPQVPQSRLQVISKHG